MATSGATAGSAGTFGVTGDLTVAAFVAAVFRPGFSTLALGAARTDVGAAGVGGTGTDAAVAGAVGPTVAVLGSFGFFERIAITLSSDRFRSTAAIHPKPYSFLCAATRR
jgi:PPE-repeat protein